AVAVLQGSDFIVHGGDIGDAAILDALRAIAPLTVVRGNNDREAWAAGIPETDFLDAAGMLVYAIHDLSRIDIDPAAAGVRVVVSGHSHIPKVEERGGVLYVNPGSAGPRRFKLPIAVAELIVVDDAVTGRIVE
ncbi:metallophosphoesterase family protein, partial [Rhizobium redzepovicii]|uniref:metallophosphoesterase family protein n=1 Tax=Rhizobium redzepovicii TaxID=2867518 RepID=UPI001C930366